MRYDLTNLKGRYTVRQLLTVANIAKREADAVFIVGEWPHSELNSEQWLNWFREKLMVKISSRGNK